MEIKMQKPIETFESSQRDEYDIPMQYAISIDLGTKHCCVAVFCNGKVNIIRNLAKDNANTVPSCVEYNNDDTDMAGYTSKRSVYRYPKYTLFESKRIIGRSYYDAELRNARKSWNLSVVNENERPRINVVGNRIRYPAEISASLLHHEITRKPARMVPAYISTLEGIATCQDAQEVGLEVLCALEESYLPQSGTYLTVVLVSTVQMFLDQIDSRVSFLKPIPRKYQTFRSRSFNGDFWVEGAYFPFIEFDFDNMEKKIIQNYFNHRDQKVLQRIFKAVTNYADNLENEKHNSGALTNIPGKKEMNQSKNGLFLQTRKKKSTFLIYKLDSGVFDISIGEETQGQTRLICSFGDKWIGQKMSDLLNKNTQLTRMYFNDNMVNHVDSRNWSFKYLTLMVALDLCQNKSIEMVEAALHAAKSHGIRGIHDIDRIILVGKLSRHQLVREHFLEYLNRTKVAQKNPSPKEISRIKAQLHFNANIQHYSGNQCKKVIPIAIGIQCNQDQISVIIPAGSRIPCAFAKVFVAPNGNKTPLVFTVCQVDIGNMGTSSVVGEFVFTDISAKVSENDSIMVAMRIETDGVLEIKAKSFGTKVEQCYVFTFQ